MDKKTKIVLAFFLSTILISTFLTYKKYIIDGRIIYTEDESTFQQALLESEA